MILFQDGKRNDTIHFSPKTCPQNYLIGPQERSLDSRFHDFNCGLKAYRNEVIKTIEVYGEMHRYIPVLAVNAGFSNIVEKVVIHQARKYGTTKFGMERFINGFLDLITIWFTSKFGKRPMHFFGLLGVIMFVIGLGFATYLGVDKLFLNPSGRLIANRPEFFIALSTMIIGTQFFVAGFLGEIILQTRQNKRTIPCYRSHRPLNYILKKSLKTIQKCSQIFTFVKNTYFMSKTDLLIQENIATWLSPFFDEDTKNTIEKLQTSNPEELNDSFYKNLEFGTGGMRGVMGVGTNRINKYTLGKNTQGLSDYLHQRIQISPLKQSLPMIVDTTVSHSLKL